MEQRLIDANALKKEVGSTFHGAIGLTVTGAVHEVIDRQPTIDPESLRPRGRWKDACYYHDCPLCYECSNCGLKLMYKPNYCPHCGCFMENKNGGSYVKK